MDQTASAEPVQEPAKESPAAKAFAEYQKTGVKLPGTDCDAAAMGFTLFCRDQGMNVEHVFVEIDAGRDLLEHYMVWFPEERVIYDLAPHNPFKHPGVERASMQMGLPAVQPDVTHAVYTPQDILMRRWRFGMNGLGWPGLDPGAIQL